MLTLNDVTSFDYLCTQVNYPYCPLLGSQKEPSCFSRNVEIGNRIFFQPAAFCIYIIAFLMTGIMIHNIKVKYTAVGKKEMVVFFYLYLWYIFVEFLVISGAIPMASSVYVYFVCLYMGSTAACFWCLFLNGCIPFQWTQDGTPRSVWFVRLTSLLVMVTVFLLALATIQSWPLMSAATPYTLFFVYYGLQVLLFLAYLILQFIFVWKYMDHRWPLGDLFFGILFFVVGQIMIYFFSITICESASHYIDGIFFGIVFSLLAVMMVYKYWDSITKDDLEFAIPSNKIQLTLSEAFLQKY